MFSDPASLEMICGPLRSLVRYQHGNLLGILKHLAVLEARFQQRYLREEEMDWTRNFDTDTQFFDSVTTMSPRDLAGVLTESDLDLFCQLDPQEIITGGPHLRHMHREWNRRCQAAQESIVVESHLSTCLVHLAQASMSFDVKTLGMLMRQSGVTYSTELLQLVRYTPSSARNRLR